ncbi:MAG: galactose oxidase-like domain-containing protein [Granulosicoccus sp.]
MLYTFNRNTTQAIKACSGKLQSSLCVLVAAVLGCTLVASASDALAHDGAHNIASRNTSTSPSRTSGNTWTSAPAQTDQPSLPAVSGLPLVSVPGNRVNAGQYGRWSDVIDWPVLAVHAALLPTGRVMAWDATPDDFDDDPHTTENYTTRVTVWDPATGDHIPTNNDTQADLFCAGSAHLWDGRVLFAGGDSGREGRNGPLSNSSVYDPWTNTWTQADSLSAPRWYSSVAALSNGEMLTFGGTYSPRPIAEVFKFNQQWRDLPISVPFTLSGDYSWLQATSSGDVMYLGPHNSLSTLSTEASGLWSAGPERDAIPYRGYGSYALFDIDKALVVGGGDSLASSVVVDMSTQTTTPTAPLSIGRRQHNLTILADGSVLASGGNFSGADLIDLNSGALTPELWRPATGLWEPMADMPITRQYHSIALLLPDGRVLSAGGGYCGVCGDAGYHEQNAEIFSPPYLFDDNGNPAQRPELEKLPEQVNYGDSFVVRSDDAYAVKKAHLIKLGSVTHSQNQDQRLIPVSFRSQNNTLLITAPENREIAPPGHYLLYVIDTNGTPSVGQILQIGQPLIKENEVVVKTVRENRWDYYAIDATGDHALTVYLHGESENIDLVLNAGEYPTLSDAGQGQFACVSRTDQSGTKLCTGRATENTTWYIGVHGRERVDYSLVAHIDDASNLPRIPVVNPSLSLPATPLNVRAALRSSTDAEIYWDMPDNDDVIVHYEIFRDGRLIAVESGSPHFAKGLQPAQRYTYQIVAVDTQQNRSVASVAHPILTLPDPNPDLDALYHPEIPTAPSYLRVFKYSETSLELIWERSIDNGFVAGYEIYRDDVLLDTREGVSYVDSSLQPATQYTYRVVAVDDDRLRSTPSQSLFVDLSVLDVPDSVVPDITEPVVDESDVDGPPVEVELPANDSPVVDAPAVDLPASDVPVINTPSADEPGIVNSGSTAVPIVRPDAVDTSAIPVVSAAPAPKFSSGATSASLTFSLLCLWLMRCLQGPTRRRWV